MLYFFKIKLLSVIWIVNVGFFLREVSEAIFVVTSAIKDVCGKPPTERIFLDKYGRICLCLDEIVWKVSYLLFFNSLYKCMVRKISKYMTRLMFDPICDIHIKRELIGKKSQNGFAIYVCVCV